ncbi:2-C-methyl-D-erythritol 2,4-cyclodiphosphate synthase [Candidatus Peregrinibacteria bacterium]|nr:2-C-methyl-D-erythritol 2,4-cyclodiphosphate synthase [Candidatus Peregrinibacteria bacterium]
MNFAVILAGGSGKRLNSKIDKMLLSVNEKPLIYYSIIAYNDHPDIAAIFVVANKNNQKFIKKTVKEYRLSKVKKITLGGDTRQQSMENGLAELGKIAKPEDIILVHNGANPLVTHGEISSIIEGAVENGACIVGHKVTSTVKEIQGHHVVKTHDRDRIFLAETPQAAKFGLLKKALKEARKKGVNTTDEAMLLETINQEVAVIEADENNFKITTSADYEKLRLILGEPPKDFRIGIGQDSHLFDGDKKGLVLAGVEFKEGKKLEANSDGDVILHAIFNAISQALGEKSIGFYADPLREKGVRDSVKYLEVILEKMRKMRFGINSMGLMIECKIPKIDPITFKLKKSLSEILGLDTRKIGITATSGEYATAFGQGLGIQCFAVVSLIQK